MWSKSCRATRRYNNFDSRVKLEIGRNDLTSTGSRSGFFSRSVMYAALNTGEGQERHMDDEVLLCRFPCPPSLGNKDQKMVSRTKSPAVARLGRSYRLYSKACVRLLIAERKRFSRVTAVQYTVYMVTLLYQML